MHATLRLFTKVAFVLTSPNAQVKEVELKNGDLDVGKMVSGHVGHVVQLQDIWPVIIVLKEQNMVLTIINTIMAIIGLI